MKIKSLILLTLFSCLSSANNETPVNIDSTPEKFKLLLQPKNNDAYKNFCLAMQKDEIDSFNKNIVSLLSKNVSSNYSASKLIELYKTNELKANKTLSKNLISIKTIASEIGESATGNAYIKANGKNQFESIVLGVNKDDERILDLKRGDRVELVCDNIKYTMHTPVLSGCLFRDQYAEKHIQDFVDCSSKNINKSSHIPITLYKAIEHKIETACARNESDCIDSVLKETSKKSFSIEDSLKTVIKESAIANNIEITKTETGSLISNLLKI